MTPSTGADSVPLRDRLLWLLGQELRVLAVRRGGSVERLIAAQQRESPGWQPLRFDIPVADTSQRPPAVRVTTTPADSEWPRAPLSPDPRSAEGWISAPVVGSDASEPLPWPMLWHATRRHEGPWAGQGESEFLDELLFERPERDRSALATLRRIIGERRLRASPWALRGSVPSVCFSAAPLHQRPAMRTFRAHRGRWDAEPFGIAIRAELLAQLGARPVIYGDDAVWESLSAPDRPWFQRQSTRGGKSAIDWTGEQEWRLLGDLLLADLPRDSVRVFVPDMATAARVAGESPWPVLALDTLVRADGR